MQQKINFERYGDIWYKPPYKNFQTCNGGPIANMSLQQQVQQLQPAQQLLPLPAPQVQPLIDLPLLPPPPVLNQLVPPPPAPLLLVRTPPLCKRNLPPPDLPPIQEEDKGQLGLKLQRLDPGGCQIPQEHQRLDLAQRCHLEPQGGSQQTCWSWSWSRALSGFWETGHFTSKYSMSRAT